MKSNNQLRSVRKQASKAQRYRECSDRLKQVRLRIASTDWRRLTAQAARSDAELAELRIDLRRSADELESQEGRSQQLERLLEELADSLRQADAQLGEYRQQIAGHEATIEHERIRLRDLEQERDDHRHRYLGLSARAGDAESACQTAISRLESAKAERAAVEKLLTDHRQAAEEVQIELEALRRGTEERRAIYINLMRSAAAITSQITAGEQQLAAAQAAIQRADQQLADVASQIQSSATEIQMRSGELAEAIIALEERQRAAAETQSLLMALQNEQETALRELATLRERHSAARERVSILKELEDRYEGVSAGAKEVLLLAQQAALRPAL